MTAKPKPEPDWKRIEAEYRTGLYSLRELSERSGRAVSAVRIHQRVKAEGWVADATAKVKQARQQKLARRAAVETQIEDTVEAVATQQADIVGAHKAAASEARRIVNKMLAEVDWQLDHTDLIERCIKLVDNGDPFDAAHLRQAFKQATALPARAGALQKLVNSLSTVVDIERKAYGIEDAPPAEDPYEVRLKKLMVAAGVES